MDSMTGIAMSFNNAQIMQNYSIALTKKSMDTQEQSAVKLLEMLPETPRKGQYIDVYA